MDITTTIHRALEDLGMVAGLAARAVDDSLSRYRRLDDIGRRGLAFYLLDVEERRLHQHWGHSTTCSYAQHRHDLSPRRTRELLAAGRALRELPLIDGAFCAGDLSWTQVLLLNRVVVAEHQEVWIEKAQAITTKQLRHEVLISRRGAKPREPGDAKGLPEVRFPVQTTLGTVPYQMLDLAQKKLSAERGKAVGVAELLEVALGVYLDLERKGESQGWTHVPSSLYRIVLRGAEPGDGMDGPLYVETEDGLLPVDAHDSTDTVARQRAACARCDGEISLDGEFTADGEAALDPPTPPALRRRVLARDGLKCRCCGGRHALHVHHIVLRSEGGRTKVYNLITLCARCHALIHEGLLRIAGRTQKKARFLDREGCPIHQPGRPADPSTVWRIEAPSVRSPAGGRNRDGGGDGDHDPDAVSTPAVPGEAGAVEAVTLDSLPEIVNGAWWQRHAGLIRCRSDQGLELKPGFPMPAIPVPSIPVPSIPVPSIPRASADASDMHPRSSSDPGAFSGIAGQAALLERIRIEAEGAHALGETFPHTLFTGPPGTGKTTLAQALAVFTGARLVRVNGPLVKDVACLLRLLASLGANAMLFLDEIHAVPQGVLEVLYQAMAEGRLSLTFHQGPRERTVDFELPAFTVVAATTEPAGLPHPLVTRFALREHLDFYGESDLTAMALAAAEARDFELEPEAAALLAAHARGTPRQLRSLLDRARRLAASRGERKLDLTHIEALLAGAGIDESGNGPTERRYLRVIEASPDPIPVARLARLLGMDVGTLVHEIEPWLFRRGLIRITPRGRCPAPLGDGDTRRNGARRNGTPGSAGAARGVPPRFKPSAGRRPVAAESSM